MRADARIAVGALALVAAPAAATTLGPITNPANGHQYYVTDAMMTWSDAETWAVSLDGHLVTIDGAAENAWVASQLTLALDTYWIGARDDGNTTDTIFEWASGEAWSYASWSPGEPDDNVGEGGMGDYVVIHKATGNWFDTYGAFLSPGAVAEVIPTNGIDPAASAATTLSVRTGGDGATVQFVLPRALSIRLDVFDVRGRAVRGLAAGERLAGRHELAWDGKTDGGERVPSGVYFVLLRTDAGWRTGRAVIAR